MKVSPDKGVVVELTPRQVEVIELYADGLATKGIAACLGVSPKTVSFHLEQIYVKTKTFNLVKLTKWAIRAGLTGLSCVALTSAAAQPFLVPTNPAPQVQLAWTPSTSPNITNYYMYLGSASRQYTNKITLGSVTNTSLVLNARGVPFFFAVTAQDIKGLESLFSNEVTYTAPNPPAAPGMQPVVVLVVQSAPTPAGVFADAGMSWSLSQDQAQQYYRLNIKRGFTLSIASPPIPPR